MSKKDNNTLLNVRDIVVEFSNKGRKNKAVQNVSFDINKGEVFALVGESGSGKTTIGRAIAGVQSLKDGAIYLENQIIAGRPTSIYKKNKEISSNIDNLYVKFKAISNLLNRIIKTISPHIVFLSESNSHNDLNKYNSIGLKLKTNSKEMNFFVMKAMSNINSILTNFDRMNKFLDNIHTYVPDVSQKLEQVIISKNNESKKNILVLKQNLILIHEQASNLDELSSCFTSTENVMMNDYSSYKELLEKAASSIVNMRQRVDFLFKNFKKSKIQKTQNIILSLPNAKKMKFITKYEKLLNPETKTVIDAAFKRVSHIYKKKTNLNQLEELKKVFVNDPCCVNVVKYINFLQAQNLFNENNFTINALKKFKQKILMISNQCKEDKEIENIFSDQIHVLNVLKLDFLIEQLNKIKSESGSTTNLCENILSFADEKIAYFSDQNSKYLENLNKVRLEYQNNNLNMNYENMKVKPEILELYINWNYFTLDELCDFITYLKLDSIEDLVNKSFLFRKRTRAEKKQNRKNTQMIFQDPGSSLNDKMSIFEVLSEGIDNFPFIYKSIEAKQKYMDQYNETHSEKMSIEQVKASDVKKHIIKNLISSVGLLEEHLTRYSHEFSGGQKQRIGIARALSLSPKIIVADEPISALDVSIRAQVLNLFSQFKDQFDLTYLFVTHDLSVVKYFANRIAVIYKGKIVELAETDELFSNPLHPYTKSLLSAVPIPDPKLSANKVISYYQPEKEHFDYPFDTPFFDEVCKDHFVFANQREFKNIKNHLKEIKNKTK